MKNLDEFIAELAQCRTQTAARAAIEAIGGDEWAKSHGVTVNEVLARAIMERLKTSKKFTGIRAPFEKRGRKKIEGRVPYITNTQSVMLCEDGVYRIESKPRAPNTVDLPFPTPTAAKTELLYQNTAGDFYPIWRTQTGKMAIVRPGYLVYLELVVPEPEKSGIW